MKYDTHPWADLFAIDLNHPAKDFRRDMILGELYKFTEYAVRGTNVVLKTPKFHCIIDTDQVVHFDCLELGTEHRYTFWFNKSSVSDFGDKLRNSPHKRREFKGFFQ